MALFKPWESSPEVMAKVSEFELQSCYYVQFRTDTFRFGLVSLFYGISTLFRLFNAKAILPEEQ